MEHHENKTGGEHRELLDAAPGHIAVSELYERAYSRALHAAQASSVPLAGTEADTAGESRSRLPRHPGRALREDFLNPRNLTPERLSAATGIALERLDNLLAEREPVCAAIASALAGFFGGQATFWLELQARYDR